MVKSARGFTLVELLVVISIIAILAVVVVLIINPVEFSRRARDTARLADLANLRTAINTSVQDATVSSALSVLCVGSEAYPCTGTSHNSARNPNGTGWVKVDLSAPASVSVPTLPMDPINDVHNHYVYCANNDTWEIATVLESDQQKGKMSTDGGGNNDLYEVGSSLALLNPSGGVCVY